MARREGGHSIASHYEAVAKVKGLKKPMAPPLAPEVRHLWQTFLELHRTRPTGFGPSPISFFEIDAWQRLKRWPLDPWEVEAIRKLDDLWLDGQAEAASNGAKT
jgi:hypothetical protein